MKVDTMRWIDRVVGVPLCALVSGVMRVGWALRRARPRPVRKVLFVELSEMGTTILADPAMRKARDHFGAELFFVIFAKNAGSLDLLGTVPKANTFTIRDTSLMTLALDTLAFLVWTRRNGIDTVFDLELFSRFTSLMTGLAGADRRIGFHRFHNEGLYRGEMLTHRVAYNPHIHVSKNFIALIDAIDIAPRSEPLSKSLIGDEQVKLIPPVIDDTLREGVRARIASLAPPAAVRRIVLINPNASDLLPHRRWMKDRYAETIRRVLAAHDDVLVLITGAPAEAEEAAMLAGAAADPRCISFAGKTSLAELPALYSLATLMVSNDSGPAHFAAATGLHTIVLFGPETPRLYQPLGNSSAIYAGLACSPCVSAHNHRKTACTDNVCMQAISVEQVVAAVDAALRETATAGRSDGTPAAVA